MDFRKIFQSKRLVFFMFRRPNQNQNTKLFQFGRNYWNWTWKGKTPWKLEAKPGHIIPIGFSGMFIYYFGFSPDGTEKENDHQYNHDKRWKVKMYRAMPWRTISRTWGWFCQVHLPGWSRNHLLKWYVRKYDVNLSEAIREDVKDYKSLADLFGRKLKPGARVVDSRSLVVSPCDGIVMHFGKVDETGRLEQVKGVSYSILKFLGPIPEKFKTKSLFFCVIYLSPGDYHGFHSPVDWRIDLRRHFRGELLSVRPSVANWIPGLFAINERVVYIGEWKYGFFSMTPVGASNVGSIKIYKDPDFKTNSRRKWKHGSLNEKYFEIPVKDFKGNPFGEFNLGSTIVLVFEAPDTLRFTVKTGQQIKYGQTLI